ncbi:MAG TPA: CBS domain-containing protein [Opitutaceae bacterium]|nr:CBS domain-containing protein [Opitutaceae bacterium]
MERRVGFGPALAKQPREAADVIEIRLSSCAGQGAGHTPALPLTLPMNAPVSAILDRKGRNVYSVAPGVTVADAVAEMNLHRVGSVLVIDGGQLVGIFTERDVLRRVVGADLDPRRVLLEKVMTANVITISPEATVEETMALFTEKRCRHLPVMEHGELVGTISIGDITRWMSDHHRAEAEQLKNYIAGGFPA